MDMKAMGSLMRHSARSFQLLVEKTVTSCQEGAESSYAATWKLTEDEQLSAWIWRESLCGW